MYQHGILFSDRFSLCILLSDLVSKACHYLPLRSHGISVNCDTVVVLYLVIRSIPCLNTLYTLEIVMDNLTE